MPTWQHFTTSFITLKLFVFHTNYPNQSVAGSHKFPSPKSRVTWGPSVLSRPLRAHGSWDLSLHMGSLVLSPKYDVDAYMATFCHLFFYTQAICNSQVLSPTSLEVHPCNLDHWERMEVWDLSLHMGSLLLSPKYDVDAYMATFFWRQDSELVLRVGSSKKPDPTPT